MFALINNKISHTVRQSVLPNIDLYVREINSKISKTMTLNFNSTFSLQKNPKLNIQKHFKDRIVSISFVH